MDESLISAIDVIEMVKTAVQAYHFEIGAGEITGRFYSARILKNGNSVGVIVVPAPIAGGVEVAQAVVAAAVRESLGEAVKEPAMRTL